MTRLTLPEGTKLHEEDHMTSVAQDGACEFTDGRAILPLGPLARA